MFSIYSLLANPHRHAEISTEYKPTIRVCQLQWSLDSKSHRQRSEPSASAANSAGLCSQGASRRGLCRHPPRGRHASAFCAGRRPHSASDARRPRHGVLAAALQSGRPVALRHVTAGGAAWPPPLQAMLQDQPDPRLRHQQQGVPRRTRIPGSRNQGAPRAPRRLAGLRNRSHGPKSSEHHIADSGQGARPPRPSSRACERVTFAPSQEHLLSLTGLWSQETGPRPRAPAAYMMYTFSAWEKWKVSLVRGQTTLSSWRMDSRDWKTRPGVTAKAAQSAAPVGRVPPSGWDPSCHPAGAAPEAPGGPPPRTLPARPGPHVVAVDVAVGQHHGRVVLVHHVAGDLADQARVGAVGHGQRLRQLVQGAAAHRAVGALGAAVPLVALPVPGQGSVGAAGAGQRLQLLTATRAPGRKTLGRRGQHPCLAGRGPLQTSPWTPEKLQLQDAPRLSAGHQWLGTFTRPSRAGLPRAPSVRWRLRDQQLGVPRGGAEGQSQRAHCSSQEGPRPWGPSASLWPWRRTCSAGDRATL